MAREHPRKSCVLADDINFEFASKRRLNELLEDRLKRLQQRKAEDYLAGYRLSYKEPGSSGRTPGMCAYVKRNTPGCAEDVNTSSEIHSEMGQQRTGAHGDAD